MRLIPGRIPPTDGKDMFHFPVTPEVTLHGATKEELIRRVFEFRLRNNIAIGEVESDIDGYYCAKWPSFCVREPRDTDPSQPRYNGETMLNRVSRWVARMIHGMPKGGYPLVTSDEAEARAEICSNCPKNTAWRGGCGGCSASTLQLIQTVKQMKRTKRDGNLSACIITGAENTSSVWLAADVNPLSEEQRSFLPAQCWRK